MAKIRAKNENHTVDNENIFNHSAEHNAINDQALKLISEIVQLPDVPCSDRQNFTDENTWYPYLRDIPNRISLIIHTAYVLNNYSGTLSRANVLNNFITMCAGKGMSFLNPFYVFTLQTKNYDKLLRNEF